MISVMPAAANIGAARPVEVVTAKMIGSAGAARRKDATASSRAPTSACGQEQISATSKLQGVA
jgi:hypothetical protein